MSQQNYKWKQLEERVIFRNRFIGLRNDLVLRPDGQQVEYVVIEGRDFVTIICQTVDNKIILVDAFPYPWQLKTKTTVGGMIDEGEKPEEAAIRETEEETGHKVKNITFLGKTRISFLNTVWNYLYFANVEKNNSKPIDPNEIITVYEFSIDQIHNLIYNGDIIHSSTINAFLLAKFYNLIK
ncbi:MAG: NUDIX hydrolase [Candidatus Odinarchaeota archaeon]